MLNGKVIKNNGSIVWYVNNEFHREDGPAIERLDGYKAWYQNGVFHRVGGPAIECSSGDRRWYQNGKLHRDDGPAVELISGNKEWWINGNRHREGGPSVVTTNGYEAWYLDNKLHRKDGPAIISSMGKTYWWINGVKLPKSKVKIMKKMTPTETTMKPATKKQANESAVRNAVTVATEDQTSKFDFSNIAKLILDLQDVLKENKQLNAIKEENKALKAEIHTLKKEFRNHSNKMCENQLNLCLALVKKAPQEYFMTVATHDQAISLDDVAAEYGLYMFCLERVDSGKGLESEFRVGFKAESENTTPVESIKKFIACFKEVK